MGAGDGTTEGENKRQREEMESGDDSSVRDVAACHHFSSLLLEMHHQSLGEGQGLVGGGGVMNLPHHHSR